MTFLARLLRRLHITTPQRASEPYGTFSYRVDYFFGKQAFGHGEGAHEEALRGLAEALAKQNADETDFPISITTTWRW